MRLAHVVLLCSLWTAEALKGQQFPIPRDELYENYHGAATAATEDVHSVDYNCRYSVGRTCYCCGAFFHYIEQGRVCTKYCIAGAAMPGEPKFCQKRLIVLPFNWGDNNPDKVTLDNGGRRRQATNVHFPYDSSAPADCPQDPYMVHTEPKVQSEPVMSGNKPSSGGAVTGRTTTTPKTSSPRPGGNKKPVWGAQDNKQVEPDQSGEPKQASKWQSSSRSSPKTTTTPKPARTKRPGPVWGSPDNKEVDEAAVEHVQKPETPRSRPPVPMRKPKAAFGQQGGSQHPKRRPRGDKPVWSGQPVSSDPRVRLVTIGGNDDITTPQPSSSQPLPSRPRCPSGASCVPMGRCPSFLHDRSAMQQLARGSRAYTQALGGLRASVCDKKAKLVCCVGWS